jgi:sialate O-acetylesterase
MVLPRNRRFTLRGRDDAGTTVRVSINGKTSVAHTDGCGNWEANIAPLPAGGPYTMTVTNGKSTIKLTNILAGEVWLASGQSNMEFFLQNAADTPQNLVPDTLLRVLNMRPIIHTDAGQWDSISCSRINRLEHYVDAKWTGADDPTFSAVAWHFGRALVDSLQVPVGIICNAIGGSGTEAWIDIETLQHEIPDLLVNWTTNDYLQPWVRGRAIQNMGTQDFGARHSYEPSYLFATGIRPLAGFPIDGVIWYQGESNAHNVELHEQLLPMMVDSWRREFRNEQLPFIFAQLSSIARPSWPAFRDSQRRLSHSIPYCGMAVTSDVGDSLDVHPRLKAPVGQRLARIALHDVYSRTDITPHGPEPVRAIAMPDGTLRLVMECGYGMKSADGEPLRTFEIAETEGEYKPARVEIKNDTIILSNNTMTTPRYARYGWQPFTRANLVNSDNLPASTFRIEAESTEGGLEYGVSGAFGGTVNGRPYMAGGCNFPYADPISVAPSAKCYYQGVYDLTSGKRVASLPQRIVYGASAATPQGLVMIGGEGCKQVWLFDGTKLSDLPSLPAAVDNAYAAAIDSKIYVVGGNYDGTPSRRVLAFDLDNPDGGWRQIATLPGSARVQPVAVATDGKLYVWGGFTPRQGKNAPQVHTDGACLDLATGKWHSLPAPVNPIDGLPLTLSGGVAAMVGNEIVAVGGVNHDIFLDAITNQAADYLLHPVEWYKFNGQVCRFDPAAEKWSVGAHRTAEYARAGAAAAVVDDGATLLLIGGELKPRVRTPRVVAVEF